MVVTSAHKWVLNLRPRKAALSVLMVKTHHHSSPFPPDGVWPPGECLLPWRGVWGGGGAGVAEERRGGRGQPGAQSGRAWRERRVGALRCWGHH